MQNATYNTLYTKSNIASVILSGWMNVYIHGAIPEKIQTGGVDNIEFPGLSKKKLENISEFN